MDKKSKNTLIISIIALALVLIGVTYAYFSARITGLESASTISLTAGRMGIHYTEGDEEVTFVNIYPREEAWATKTFTLTGYNTTDMPMSYDVGLNIINNTFTDEYLSYDLRLVSSTNGTPIATTTNNPISGTGKIKFGTGTFTNADGDTHNYELKIYFKDNGEDQNDSQNAVFNAKIYVEEYNPNITVGLSRPVYSIDQQACEDYFYYGLDLTTTQITSLCSGDAVYMDELGTYLQLGVGLGIDEELIQEGILTQTGVDTSSTPQTGDKYQSGQYVYKYNHGLFESGQGNFFSTLIKNDLGKRYPTLLDNEVNLDGFYSWFLVNNNGWGISVADRDSTAPITEKIPTSINGQPIKNASYMFADSQATSIDLSSFDTSNVTDMSYMFSGSQATSLDLSSFDTSNVTNMSYMFADSHATSIDLSSFDTSNVTDMSFMFSGSQATSLDLSSFDTSNVTDMQNMFAWSQATSLDLSSFDTSNVTDMSGMFADSQATSIDLSSFDTSNVAFMGLMFSMYTHTINARTVADANRLCDVAWTGAEVYVGETLVCEGSYFES